MSSPYGSTRNDITIWEVSAWLPPSENNPFPTTCLFKRLSIFVASRGLCSVREGQATRLWSDTRTAVSSPPRAPWFCFVIPACGKNLPGSLKTGRAKRLSVAFQLLRAVDLIVPVVWCPVPQAVCRGSCTASKAEGFISGSLYAQTCAASVQIMFHQPCWLCTTSPQSYLFSILSIFGISQFCWCPTEVL